MGARKQTSEEVLASWLGSFPMPADLEDVILAEPEHELVPLVLARWLLFNREARLRPQTDPEVITALQRAARRAGQHLDRQVGTVSGGHMFLIHLNEADPLSELLRDDLSTRATGPRYGV